MKKTISLLIIFTVLVASCAVLISCASVDKSKLKISLSSEDGGNTIKANFSEYTTEFGIKWSLDWFEDAGIGNPEDYVKLEIDGKDNTKCKIILNDYYGGFNKPLKVTATSTENAEVSGSFKIDYLQRQIKAKDFSIKLSNGENYATVPINGEFIINREFLDYIKTHDLSYKPTANMFDTSKFTIENSSVSKIKAYHKSSREDFAFATYMRGLSINSSIKTGYDLSIDYNYSFDTLLSYLGITADKDILDKESYYDIYQRLSNHEAVIKKELDKFCINLDCIYDTYEPNSKVHFDGIKLKFDSTAFDFLLNELREYLL